MGPWPHGPDDCESHIHPQIGEFAAQSIGFGVFASPEGAFEEGEEYRAGGAVF